MLCFSFGQLCSFSALSIRCRISLWKHTFLYTQLPILIDDYCLRITSTSGPEKNNRFVPLKKFRHLIYEDELLEN